MVMLLVLITATDTSKIQTRNIVVKKNLKVFNPTQKSTSASLFAESQVPYLTGDSPSVDESIQIHNNGCDVIVFDPSRVPLGQSH